MFLISTLANTLLILNLMLNLFYYIRRVVKKAIGLKLQEKPPEYFEVNSQDDLTERIEYD